MYLEVNGVRTEIADERATAPLLWLLREELGLTGTKFGCGQGLCGACTVHLDGVAVRACQVSGNEVAGHRITTIEGLAGSAGLHPVQRAWIAESVPQCGYCQAGQIMAAAALLAQVARPDAAAIEQAMAGNLCRCGTYGRIRRAIHRAAQEMAP